MTALAAALLRPQLAELPRRVARWNAIHNRIAAGLAAAGAGTWAAVLWQSFANTLFGYGCWSWLLARHPAGRIVPMALLVPVFGMGASSWLLGETLPGWKLAAAGLVLAGLAINLFGPLLLAARPKPVQE